MVTQKENENKKINKKKKSRKRPIVILAVLALLILVGALFYAVPSIMNAQRENISDFGIYGHDGSDEAFLLSSEGGEIKSVDSFAGGVCVATSNSVIWLKKSGEIVDVVKTGYSMPAVRSTEKNYIIFERNTGKYTTIDKRGTVYSDQLESGIISADISESGNYMIVTQDKLSTAFVTVYSEKNEILFKWECNETYLTNCAISPNGKCFCVSTFDVENGKQVSKLLTFTTKSIDVEKETDCGNDIVYALRYLNGDTVGVVTDNRYLIVNGRNDELKTVDYEFDFVNGIYSASNNSLALLRSDFGSMDESTIAVYDRNGNEIFSKEISENVIDFCVDRSFVYVMTSCKITVYAISTGEEYEVIDTFGGLKNMEIVSNRIFCADDEGIYRYER